MPGGYRARLGDLLAAHGLAFQFVGGITDSRTSPALQHEGLSGWAIDDMLNGKDGLFPLDAVSANRPDAVLLMAGTNEFLVKGYPSELAITHMNQLLDQMVIRAPGARIFVATIFPISDNSVSPRQPFTILDDKINVFNAWLRAAVAARVAAGQPLTLLDMNAFMDMDWLDDGVHPNAIGYLAVAQAWFAEVGPWLAARANAPGLGCIANASSRAFITTSLRFLDGFYRAYPQFAANTATAKQNININIGTLIQLNWTCTDTKNVSDYVQAVLDYGNYELAH